ncbi:MAG: 3-keto-5-aminohexanoate cleavage protein [Alphaproteobacteria bacterium]|nr:3-keto-5-aminohexanoate cleavage protein [Alphaproteobacteria bacterium]
MMPLPEIMVAPNGARLSRADHPAVPLTIAETVQEAELCFRAGATGLHAHLRDDMGGHILDVGLYRELLDEMARRVPAMAVQITTEAVGRYAPRDQCDLVLRLAPGAASVAVRELWRDPEETALADFYHRAAEGGTAIQHILYDAQDIALFMHLRQTGTVPPGSAQVLFVLGDYARQRRGRPAELDARLEALAPILPELDWAACAFGADETVCLRAARARGGKIRVGFENNVVNADGSIAASNAVRVAEVASP